MAGTAKAKMAGHWRIRMTRGRGERSERLMCPVGCAEPRHAGNPTWSPDAPNPTRERRRVAERVEQEWRAALDAAEAMPTVAVMVDRHIDGLEAKGRAAATLVGYRSKAAHHIAGSTLGRMPVDEVRPMHIARQREDWAGRMAASSANQVLAIVSGAMQTAVDSGIIDRNPSREVRRVEQAAVRPSSPTLAEVRAVITDLSGRDESTAMFAFLTSVLGTRRSETLALRWSDIDLDTGWVRVERAIDTARRGATKDPKTHQARRVPIAALIVEALRRWRLDVARIHGVDAVPPAWPVIPSPGDPSVPPHPDTVSSALRRASDRLGVEVMPIGLRHFAASQMVASGVDGRTAADHLGHADPSMTLRRYAARDDTAARAAADLLGSLIAGEISSPEG